MNYNKFEHDFLHIILPTKESYIRNGQQLMIYLSSVSPILYSKIIGTLNDCFYIDIAIPKTLKWLEDNWMLQFPPIEIEIKNWCFDMLGKYPDLFFEFELSDGGVYMATQGLPKNISRDYVDAEFYFQEKIDEIYGVHIFFGMEDEPKIFKFTNKAIKIIKPIL
jgi:hypothetical protein